MMTAYLLPIAVALPPSSNQEPNALDTLGEMSSSGLDIGVLLLAFTLATFVVLVFGVRVLLVIRKRPVPVDPLDMAKPQAFRALMIVAAATLAPLAGLDFLPVDGLPLRWTLLWAYLFELLLAAFLWLALEAFYRARAKRRDN